MRKIAEGVAICRTAVGWSAPAFFAVTGGSWGLQIGLEGVDLVMIIQNEKGMQQLLASKFQLRADASAAAGPVGRHTRNQLEAGNGDSNLFSGQGRLRRTHTQWRFNSAGRRLHAGHLRTTCHDPGSTLG